mgnify:CR=1 FL=1
MNVSKGVTPVVSIALLLGITLATVGLLATQVFNTVGDSIDETASAVTTSVNSGNVIIQNSANRTVQVNSVIVDGSAAGCSPLTVNPNAAEVCTGSYPTTASIDIAAEFTN